MSPTGYAGCAIGSAGATPAASHALTTREPSSKPGRVVPAFRIYEVYQLLYRSAHDAHEVLSPARTRSRSTNRTFTPATFSQPGSSPNQSSNPLAQLVIFCLQSPLFLSVRRYQSSLQPHHSSKPLPMISHAQSQTSFVLFKIKSPCPIRVEPQSLSVHLE
jgi:hypothetical protein